MTDTLRRLSPIGWMFRKSLFGLLGWALVTVALDLLKPWPVQLAVDHVLPGKPLPGWAEWLHLFPGAPQREWLLAWTAVLSIIVLLLWWLARSAESYLQIGVGSRMTLETGRLLYDHLARVSLGFHQTNRVGDLTKRIVADSKCAKELWIDVALLMAISLATLIGMFTVLWRLNPALTLLAILSAPLIVCVVKLFAKPMSERSYAELELQGEMSAHAEQTLTALPVVQAFGREDEHDRSFRGLTERTGSAYLKAVLAQLQFGFGVSSVSAVATAAIFGLGGFFVLEGQLTVGELLVFLSYLAALLDPLETLAYLGTSYASASAGAKRVFSLIESEPVLESAPGSAPLVLSGRLSSDIRFRDVTFGYDPRRPVLKEISLEVPGGSTLALVGPSGAGKSTLLSLVPRLWDPQQGTVEIGGQDICNVDLESLRHQVAIVLQEPYLLPITIAQNIAYGRPGATRQEIEAAAEAAGAAEFIQALSRGYETEVGDRGVRLSGGQKQRIAIARAFLKNAPVILLDEPTAALDVSTEKAILEALERLVKGRTTIIAAHRLSTIRHADRIAAMENGMVSEIGSHHQLIRSGGIYSQWVEMQTGHVIAAGGRA